MLSQLSCGRMLIRSNAAASFAGPRPVLGDADDPSPGGVGEDRGGVEQAETQPFRFCSGEFAVQAEVLGPTDEVLGDHDQGQPGLIDRETGGGQILGGGGFRVADPLFHAPPTSVKRFKEGGMSRSWRSVTQTW